MTIPTTLPVEIPLVLDNPLYNIRITLDGQEYILEFDYCEREFRWYLSIFSVAGLPLSVGIKVVANWPLLRKKADPALPPGVLIATDATSGEPPTFQDLGRRVRLLYYPKS